MRRPPAKILLLILAASMLGNAGAAFGHACTDPEDESTCEDTPVMPNWRDQYVPLFDLEDRDDEQQRYDAQRWRDECDQPNGEANQSCTWADFGMSLFNEEGDFDPASSEPQEAHAGFAASHCFLFEFAHQCEDHDASLGEGVHDAHGGATYVDVCLAENPDNKFCDEGIQDTQAGVTIMDHNACGTVVPIVACTDEYHVVRPFDSEYTMEQMADSVAAVQKIADDPATYVCGHHPSGQSCRDAVNDVLP